MKREVQVETKVPDVMKIIELLEKGAVKTNPLEKLDAGSILIEEGGTDTDIYIIKDGTLEVIIGDNKVAELQAPAIVGEMALLFDKRSATVKAATEISFRRIRPEQLSQDALDSIIELAEYRDSQNVRNGHYKR